ncbi:MAG: helix-turn-helix transcriptional regulator [Bryobacteraceae bacterium]
MRRARERLGLTYRDVAEASEKIANQRGRHEFTIGLSRLSDIENKGTLPSVYRLYSLCAVYSLDFTLALRWYGISLQQLIQDSAAVALDRTHPVDFQVPAGAEVDFPAELDRTFDIEQTSYLTGHIKRWGKLPLILLNSLDLKNQRYGFIGANDWSMYPIIAPGSFIQIDENRRRISDAGWVHEYERPIYFIEHRNGYRCAWCTETGGLLIVQPHSSSHIAPEVFRFPGEAELIGQVVGVAMRFNLERRRRTRS